MRLDSGNGKARLSNGNVYLSVRQEKGEFIHKNFPSMNGINLLPLTKSTHIRKQLGDFVHINFFQMSLVSTMYVQPRIIEDIMRICRLVGFYMVRSPSKTFKVESVLDKLVSKEKEPWKLPANKFVGGILRRAWKKTRIGEVMDISADKSKKQIVCRMKDIGCSIKAIDSKYCSLAANLCGIAEALAGGIWTGELLKCQHMGEPYCEVRIFPGNENFMKSSVEREEYAKILDSVAEDVAKRRLAYPREKLGERFHFSLPQCTNFLLTTPTIGHSVLRKHAGVVTGERIGDARELESEQDAFDYLRDLFRYFGAGILDEPGERGEDIMVRMDESVYASGVKNINMKLDVFLAGIVEGMLNRATDDKWQVNETKCLANGDEHCEFVCRKITSRTGA